MKAPKFQRPVRAGISLVETIVSVGVLAVVIPLAMAAMLKAGSTGASARAETRAPAIADFCMVELRAAREGRSAYFPPIGPGQDFGSGDTYMALGFGRDGSVVGKIDRAGFENGITSSGEDQIYYMARISGKLDTETREVDLVTVTVDVEFPAIKPTDKRSRASFHTKLP